ncbi:putative MarR family transcriptional regulator [Gordonia effusa NBRC 100432]|uniref:Putative MarR family transcriptional regulator n=1 Tax=Gordonia effusa NBRC 100432 TaxID=1077974 RepID=H0R058_9ACTN|nr:MarR family transcriptional regulator [Gordonia effusa]GAB18459.1 putative MarR family transcriptional regulator [Gordonia effusa NBRC 100432]
MPVVDEADVWPSPLYADIVAEFRRLARRKTSQYVGAQLDGSAFAILLTLSDGRARTLRELSVELELEQSTINRQVNAAIKHGFLERFEVAGQVSRLIRPTTAGQQAFHHDGMLRVDRLNRVFGDLSPGTPQALLTELRAYNDAYDRAVDDDTE